MAFSPLPPSLPQLADLASRSLSQAAVVLHAFTTHPATAATIASMGRHLGDCFASRHKVLICGNGGSLCDAVHFAEELTGRFREDRVPLPALALADAGHITCTANDYGYDQVFARAVRAFGHKGDCLILLSTSGNSRNCLLALQAAKECSMSTLALLGKGGGALADAADIQLLVPGETSDRIQELHMLVLHILVELIEAQLAP